MPRDVKLTLGRDIYSECMAMVTLIAKANAARDKVPHLQQLSERLETVRTLVRVAHDTQDLSHKAFAQAIELMDNVGRQAGGWLRSVHRTPAAPAA